MAANHLINWDMALPVLGKLSLVQVYIAIVALSDNEGKWYSNEESRAAITWRWQIASSTVKTALRALKEESLILTNSRGAYTLNKKFLNGRV